MHALTRPRNALYLALMAIVLAALTFGLLTAVRDASSGAASTNPDTIQYVQTTGSSGTYLQYVPGDGSKVTKQSVTSGGGCATPTVSGAPLLAFNASYFATGYASGVSTVVPVGAYKSRTGVCSVGQAWSIEQNEQLTFGIGTNSLVAGRLFTKASIVLQRQDKSTASDPPVVVHLVMRRGATVVATQDVSIPGPNGTNLTADTGTVRSGFDAIDLQVTSPSTGSVSVVGPTSTFTLASQLCVSDTINTQSTDGVALTDQVKATLTYVSNSVNPVCKTYTNFSATENDSTGARQVDFATTNTPGAVVTMNIDWGTVPKCRPDNLGPEPQCPTSTIDFNDGTGEHPQTFCTAANPPSTPPWCTTGRTYQYVTVTDPSTGLPVTLTRITETWSGFGDPTTRLR